MTPRSTRLLSFVGGKLFTAVIVGLIIYLLATPADIRVYQGMFGHHYAIVIGFWLLWIYIVADLTQRGFGALMSGD